MTAAGASISAVVLIAGLVVPASAAPAQTPRTGDLIVKTPGAVVENLDITGSIYVQANNVTIRNVTVRYGKYHSIRIDRGTTGITISDTDVYCLSSTTNGVVFGGYHAQRVRVNGCRHDFLFSDTNPATVVDSSIDGVPYSNVASTSPTSRSSASNTPTSTRPTTPTSTTPTSTTPTSTTPTSTTSRPSTTTTTRPPTTTSAGGSLPAGGVPSGYPNAASTGVRDGVTLRDSGSITVSQAGTVISALRVSGTITVTASNVTIRDTLVQGGGNGYPIRVANGVRNVLIEYVELDNLDSTGIGIFFNGGSGTVRNADIHSAEDGIRVQADDVVIENSYIHDLQRYSGGHHDSIQIREGNNVTIRGNSLLPYVASTGDPMNAAIQIGSLSGPPLQNLSVENNFMNGGNYTINTGSAGDVASARYVNNVFGPNSRYGAHSALRNSVWQNNTWYNSGALIP